MTNEEQSKVNKYYADLKKYNDLNIEIDKKGDRLIIPVIIFFFGFFLIYIITFFIPIGFLGYSDNVRFNLVICNLILFSISLIRFWNWDASVYKPIEPTKPQRQIVRYEQVTEYVSVWVEDTYYFGPRGGKYKVQDNGRGRVYVGDHIQSSGYWTSEPRTYNKKIVEFENLIN
jgi:hypothetical protein